MGSRYYITGVQLALLKLHIEKNFLMEKDKLSLAELLIEIYENQYVGDKLSQAVKG